MGDALVILAGGKGSRLGSLTTDTPKPMVEICGKPFLYWLINHYRAQGFKDVVISVGHLASVIEEYPWPWPVTFLRDTETQRGWELIIDRFDSFGSTGIVIANGDTWVHEPLPTDVEGPWILTCNDVDAGVQRVALGCIKLYCTPFFIDMGTPPGLTAFTVYCKTHLDGR